MKINPNVTPKGISLTEINEIAKHNEEKVRYFKMESGGHEIHIIAVPHVYLSDDFGDSQYFAEEVPNFIKGRLLEIGTGTGIVAIAYACRKGEYFGREEKHVVTDINVLAIRNIKINILINGVDRSIEIRLGDVFEPLGEGEKFDTIFWAHPFHKGSEGGDMPMRACFDPLFRGLEEYVQDGHQFLNKGGKLLLGSGNFADLGDMKEIMDRHRCEMRLIHFIHRPIKVRSGRFNTYNIYEIIRKDIDQESLMNNSGKDSFFKRGNERNGCSYMSNNNK